MPQFDGLELEEPWCGAESSTRYSKPALCFWQLVIGAHVSRAGRQRRVY